MPQHPTDHLSTLVQVMAITWANVDPDLCRQMASLGLNELNTRCPSAIQCQANNGHSDDQGPLLLTCFNFNPSMDK